MNIEIDKNNPSEIWIESLNKRFTCEAELEKTLNFKLRNRSGTTFSPISLHTMSEGIVDLLKNKLQQTFEVRNLRWLSGGASKIQIAFELNWNPSGLEIITTTMVLRMEPAASIVETSRVREFQLLSAMKGVIPVPDAYWIDSDATYFPYPAFICGFNEGVTKPSNTDSTVSGIGVTFPEKFRRKLGEQFIDQLAQIHTYDWQKENLPAFDIPVINSTQGVEWKINLWERIWEEDAREEIPLMRFVAHWLRANMPTIDRISVLHGDYRTGNFLFDEKSMNITAWLDWEGGSLGDRHDDLAYAAYSSWGSYSDDGKSFLICGLVPEEEFFDTYESVSGLSVDKKRLDYYRILNGYKLCCIGLATACRVMHGSKTHQDIVLSYATAVSYPILDDLRNILEEIL